MSLSPSRAKLAAIAAALVLALALGACGDDDSGSDGESASSVAENLPPMPADGRYFAAQSPWNTRIDRLPASPRSVEMLHLAGERRAVVEAPGKAGLVLVEKRADEKLQINSRRWAPLIVRAGGQGSVATEMVCRQSSCGSDLGEVPEVLDLPEGTRPDPRYDGWLSVIDTENRIGYDFWRARRQSGDTISFQYAKAWALGGPGFSRPVSVNPSRAVGARGSGLPLFAGVIGPQELRAGEIDHALAISVPGLARRNYVQPASVTDGVGPTDSLPAGARIRLGVEVSAEDLGEGARRPAAEAILVALRRYGAIVVDRASVPTLYAAQGTPADLVGEDELEWLSLDDFEVVALPPILKDPPLDQVQQVGVPAGDRPVGGGG